MMRKLLLFCALLLSYLQSDAKFLNLEKPVFSGLYFQWGYNRDKFTTSTIHFKGANYDFTLHDAVAKDKPDFSGFWDTPLDITIPQNSMRLGVYLNKKHTHAIELNFDHAKYVVVDYQKVRISGQVRGEVMDRDTILDPHFVHFEHTNGANFLQLDYVGQQVLWRNKKRVMASWVWKMGAGVVVPRSDVTILGKRLDNEYHVAGYIISPEIGARFYATRNLFLEAVLKGGFANYLNVNTVEGAHANHHFWYGMVAGFLGYDINFKKQKREPFN